MSSSPRLSARRSNLGRLHAIVGVLVRHGVADMLHQWSLGSVLERLGHRLHLDRAAELAQLPRPVQLRQALEELGPTFVKLGQILAGRADMFGPE